MTARAHLPAAGLIAIAALALELRAEEPFVAVCNKANPVAAISPGELRRLFTGGIKQWDSGAVVRIGIIPSDAPETKYLAGLLDVSTTELLSRIQQQVFKGEMRRPAVLRSSADCAAFARSDPGAICIADARSALPAEARAVPVR
jgi:hypothetical protein